MISLFIGPIGAPEIAVIVLLAVLLFGADKIPKIARSAGKAQKEFEKAKIEAQNELEEAKEKTQQSDIKQDQKNKKDNTETEDKDN